MFLSEKLLQRFTLKPKPRNFKKAALF